MKRQVTGPEKPPRNFQPLTHEQRQCAKNPSRHAPIVQRLEYSFLDIKVSELCEFRTLRGDSVAENTAKLLWFMLPTGEWRTMQMNLHDWQTLSRAVAVLQQLSARRDVAEQQQMEARGLAEQLDRFLVLLPSSEDQ